MGLPLSEATINEAYRLRTEGMTYTKIAEQVGASKSAIHGHLAPGQRARDRARWRRKNSSTRKRKPRSAYDKQRHMKPDAPDAKPTQAPSCKCETPWAVNEVVHENPIVTEVKCLKCAREIR